MVGSGADGSTFPHGTQALEFESLVKRSGMTPARAIQAGTIVNAEVMGWQGQIGSDDQGEVCRSDCRVWRPAGRHHRASTSEVRDEGREDHPKRSDADGSCRDPVAEAAEGTLAALHRLLIWLAGTLCAKSVRSIASAIARYPASLGCK